MTEPPISAVPGFVREEVAAPPPASPLISALPTAFVAPAAPAAPAADAPQPIVLPPAPPASAPLPPAPPVSAPLVSAPLPVVPLPPAPPELAPPEPPELAPPEPPEATPAIEDPFAVMLDTMDDDVEATRRVAPQVPALVVRWDDGTVASVTTTAVIGRNPGAGAGEIAIPVEDSTMSLSKTHARLTPVPPTVEDLHSTNGVIVERSGVRTEITPGVPFPLRAGDVLVIGARRAIVEVTSP